MMQARHTTPIAEVAAVRISSGGVPKRPVRQSRVICEGRPGDGHNHDRHRRPHRAVCIQDLGLLENPRAAGFAVGPGVVGENLMVRSPRVQKCAVDDLLHCDNGPAFELTEPQEPCHVLDTIRPAIRHVVVGRCGFMTSAIEGGGRR
jgi:MOSC domain-containing protein YiiM